jgi:hypothetical protein
MNSQQEDLLRDDLRQIVGGQPFAPDIEAIERRGHQLRRRSTALRGAAGLGVAAGITAVALAVSGVSGGPAIRLHHSQRQSGPVASGAAPSVRTIEARTVAALTSVGSNSVLRTVVTTAAGVTRFTVDQPDQMTTVVHTVHGRKTSEMATRQAPGQAGLYQTRLINFTARTWSEQDVRGSSQIAIPNPAAEYRTVFKPSPNGRVRFVGAGTLDGQPVYKISFTGLHSTKSTAIDWISKATYLPIKSVSPGATVAYTWSGAGSVPGARLWPGIPAGFAKVPFFREADQAKRGGL